MADEQDEDGDMDKCIEAEECPDESSHQHKQTGWKKHLHINRSYIPLKLIYFFFMAGVACALPYRSIFMKHLGLSTEQTGIIWTFERVVSVILPPFLGAITDKSRRPKLVLIVLLLTGSAIIFAMYFVPQENSMKLRTNNTSILLEEGVVRQNASVCWKLECSEITNYCKTGEPQHWEPACNNIRGLNIIESVICPGRSMYNAISPPNGTNDISTIIPGTASPSASNSTEDYTECIIRWPGSNSIRVALRANYTDTIFDSVTESRLYADAELLCVDYTSSPDRTCELAYDTDEYGVTFWLIFSLVAASSIATTGSYPVIESGVLTALGRKNRHRFGQQRLWAAVGFGSAALAVGYFKDRSTDSIGVASGSNRPFLPMFVGVVIFWVCASIVATKLPISASSRDRKKTRLKDIRFVLMRPKALAFYAVVLFYGMDVAVHEIYLYWLAEDKLNASTSILGASAFVGTVLDIPFCIAAGPLIRRFGHTALICFGVIALSVRLILCGVVVEPWQLIAVEALKGITWGLTWVVICSYTAKISPRGLETLTMGLTQATLWGLGYGTGALLGGVLFQAIGGDKLFLLFGGMSMAAAVLFGLFTFFYRENRGGDENASETKDESDGGGKQS